MASTKKNVPRSDAEKRRQDRAKLRQKQAAKRKDLSERSGAGTTAQPSTRVFTDWTPALIRQAEMAADHGDLRLAAKLCDWLIGDDRIGPLLMGRADALLGIEPTFESSGDKRRSAKVVRALEIGEDYWACYPRSTSKLLIIWGIVLGIGPARQAWPEDPETGRVLAKPEFWHPIHWRRDEETRQWLVNVRANGQDEWRVAVPGDGEWILHTPYDPNRPWAMGLWRGLARLALLKALAIGDWARHSEKGSIIAVTADVKLASEDSTSLQQRQQLADDIFNRGRDTAAALPPGHDIKLVQTLANSESIYKQQIEMVNTAAAVAIRGGNLTTEVGAGGSNAAAEAQAATGEDVRLEADAEAWVETIHDQSLVWWAQHNYGDRRLAPWPSYKKEKREDLKEHAEGARKMGFALAKLMKMGAKIKKEGAAEFIRRYKLDGILEAPDGLNPGPDPVVSGPKATAKALGGFEPDPDGTGDPEEQIEEREAKD